MAGTTGNPPTQSTDFQKPDQEVNVGVKPDTGSEQESQEELTEPTAPLRSNKAFWGWLILCFSTGPTSSMAFNYVSAAIQSAANLVGHVPGTNKPCATRGNISCVVNFGSQEINYVTYLLYLKSIGRALEGVISIIVAGAADYSDYRKPMMMTSIYLFGALALPFAGLTNVSYSYLTGLSVLYCLLTVVQGVYTVIEASYIPIFMRSAGWFQPPKRLESGNLERLNEGTDANTNRTWKKGSLVSVLGLVSSNVGGLVALLIGVIITYSRGTTTTIGYFDYLLAITIAGCCTIVFAIAGHSLLPNIPGKEKPKNKNIILLPLKTWLRLLRSITAYPEAFKLCIAWILWNTGYSNFLGLLGSLFLQVAGLTNGSSTYTVYSFTAVIFACMGSLGWLFSFSHVRAPIKTWAYIFLSINILCVFWGCLGINDNVPIGYKYQPEFWVAQLLFMTTSSALRSYNRVLYASLIPKGSEALFFGLEITLDLATGWINPLVQGVIQDHTGNLRYPMLPNLFLMLVSLVLYITVRVEKGIEDARKPLAISLDEE